MAEHDSWKKENLENTKKVVTEFERKLNTKIRRQEKFNRTEERNFRKELLGRYIAKVLYE